MRPLLIPYAIDVERHVTVSAADIADMMEDPSSTVRLQATARLNTRMRRPLKFTCPACGQQLYPHAPVFNGSRYFWSHLPRGAYECPLEVKRKLTPDQINARIFHGRQEGEAHKNLVALLARLAEADPNVGSITLGVYERPTEDMRTEFPFGRFPDVQFQCEGKKVVLEAQLATITLHGINGRRAFYDRMSTTLLWVMRNFDPTGPMRASVRDIVADQGGLLFSVDSEVIAECEADGRFRLRVWAYHADREEPWEASIVTIAEAAARARPRRWADDFKERWVKAYQGGYYHTPGLPDPHDMLNEAAEQAGLPPFNRSSTSGCILSLVRLLISLEAGFVTGSSHPHLISIANNFNFHGGHPAVTLVEMAIKRWQPDLLLRESMQKAFERARAKLKEDGERAWGRLSAIGKLRDVLFPDWTLGEARPAD